MEKYKIEEDLAQKAAILHSDNPDAFLAEALRPVPKLMKDHQLNTELAKRVAVIYEEDAEAMLEIASEKVPGLRQKHKISRYLALKAQIFMFENPDAFIAEARGASLGEIDRSDYNIIGARETNEQATAPMMQPMSAELVPQPLAISLPSPAIPKCAS